MKSSWLSLAVVVILSIYCINAAPTRTISTQATEAAGESANEFPFLDNNGDDEDGSSSTCTTTAPPIVSLADIKSSLLQTKSIILEAIRDHAESVDDGDEDLLVKRLEEAVTSFDVEEAQDQIQIEQMQTALNDIITCSICLDKFTKDTTFVSNCCHIFHERCMQHHIVATDHAPGFAKCPLCRGDIVGDALSFIEFGSHRHQAGFSSSGSRSSPLDLVNRIIEIVQSSSEEPEVSTSSLHGDHHVNDGFKLDRLLDTSTSQRTRWIKRIQQAASAILHRRWDREEYHEDIRGDDEEEHVVDDEEQRANDRSMVLLEQSLENMEARNERPLTDVRVDTVCFYFMMAGCFPIFFFLGFSIIAPILGLPGLLLWIAHFIMIRLNEIH